MAEEREKQPRHGRHTNNGNSDRTSGDGKISPPDERGDRAASGMQWRLKQHYRRPQARQVSRKYNK